MTLTAKQREVIERMAAGESLRSIRFSPSIESGKLHKGTFHSLCARKLISLDTHASSIRVKQFKLTELGRAAAKGKA